MNHLSVSRFDLLRTIARFALLVTGLVGGLARGQAPAYLSAQHDPQRVGASPLVWAFSQDPSGVLYAANNDGVLIYDGARWRLVPTDRPVRALAVDADGTVYVGCVGDLGRLVLGPDQRLRYASLQALLPKAALGEREFQLYVTASGVMAVGEASAWLFESAKLLPKITPIGLPGPIDGSAVVNGQVVVNIAEKGLHRLAASGAKAVAGGEALAEDQLVAGVTLASGDGLLLTSADRFYRLGRSGGLQAAGLEELTGYAQKHQGLELVALSGGSLVLATLKGGVGLAGADGNLRRPLRRGAGLPDDNIYALFVDRENGLWVAHGRGLTRLMVEAPVEHYRRENGLSGTVSAVLPTAGELYLATVQGLYRRAGGAFEPVSGLSNECWRLARIGDDVLAAANDGLYRVTGNSAKRVVEASYATDLVALPTAKGQRVGWVVTADGVQGLQRADKGYQLEPAIKIDVPADDISGLSVAGSGDLLIHTAYQGVWRLDGSGIVSVATDTLQGYPTGGASALAVKTGLLFTTRQGLFYADAPGAKAQSVSLLPDGDYGRVEALAAAGDTVVIATAQGPRVGLLQGAQLRLNPTDWAHLVPGRAAVAAFGGRRLYLALQDELYNLPLRLDVPGQATPPILVTVSAGARDSLMAGETWWRGLRQGSEGAPAEISLGPDLNAVKLQYALPQFDQAQANHYQVRFAGAGRDTAWSTWTTAAEQAYAGLRPGDYSFSVRARDAYGYVTEPATLRISIPTPFYLTWWAIAVYVLLGVGLVLGAGKMLARNAELRAIALDQIVQDRTREVKQQKEKIETQVVELNVKNKELDTKNSELDKKNSELDKKNTELDRKNSELDSALREVKVKNNELDAKNAQLDAALNDLKNTQDQLIQQEKMASLGQLVAGVAHEINTPVGIGVTAASKLELRTKELAAKVKEGQVRKSDFDNYMNFAVEGCDMILKNLNRAAELIQSFKRVAVDQSADDERRINLYEYLHEVIVSVSPSIKKSKVNVALNGPHDLELVTSPSSLSQIVINLVMNALTHAFENEQEGVIRIAFERSGEQLKLTIADTGKGIPPEVLPKIFDPFFTTNRSKGGSGLGLHIVYNLVASNLKGNLTVASELGKGTTFTIAMPIVA